MNKKVSVIIPTFNGCKHIKKSIESVFSQTFKDFEIIVIDDGSTDHVYEVLIPYIKNNTIKYIRQENSGPGPARKNGILNSNGEYIACIDDDDIWIDNDKLKKQVDFLDNNKDYVLCGTQGLLYYEEDNKYKEYNTTISDSDIRSKILAGNQFIQSSIMFRRNSLGDLSDFPVVKVGVPEDYILVLQLGIKGKMTNLPEKMISYTMRSGSITDNNRKSVIKSSIKIIKKYKKYYPNYYKAVNFFVLKYIVISILSLMGESGVKNKILKFALRIYRKIISG